MSPNVHLTGPVVGGDGNLASQWLLLTALPDGVPLPVVLPGKSVASYNQLHGFAPLKVLDVFVHVPDAPLPWNKI